jgi:hypothetical protein
LRKVVPRIYEWDALPTPDDTSFPAWHGVHRSHFWDPPFLLAIPAATGYVIAR